MAHVRFAGDGDGEGQGCEAGRPPISFHCCLYFVVRLAGSLMIRSHVDCSPASPVVLRNNRIHWRIMTRLSPDRATFFFFCFFFLLVSMLSVSLGIRYIDSRIGMISREGTSARE